LWLEYDVKFLLETDVQQFVSSNNWYINTVNASYSIASMDIFQNPAYYLQYNDYSTGHREYYIDIGMSGFPLLLDSQDKRGKSTDPIQDLKRSDSELSQWSELIFTIDGNAQEVNFF
jgi:hypothetical protein